MIRFVRDEEDDGILWLITDDANAELAQLEDEDFAGIVPAFDGIDRDGDDDMFKLALVGLDTEDLEAIVGTVGRFDALAARQLEELAFS